MKVDASEVLLKSLRLGGLVALAVLVVAGAVSWIVAGVHGLVAAGLAVAIALAFLGLTAVSILVGNRLAAGRGEAGFGIFFGTVAGGWLVKLVAFMVALWLLRGADWLQPQIFGAVLIVAVLGLFAADVWAFVTSRPADLVLPDPSNGGEGPEPRA